MNDASNSLARMYFNTVKDFHRQATIDYVLGNTHIVAIRILLTNGDFYACCYGRIP